MGVLGILLLLAIVLTVVIIIQRSVSDEGDGSAGGADIVAYLVLALAMSVAGFALADLASTAFPGDRFVFDPAEELATSLSALVVSTPFLIYFWRRQASRRDVYPESPGWTLYLSLIELVFMTAFVIVAALFVNGLVAGESTSSWPGVLVFGGILAFHDYAARQTPPLSDAGETQRVLGSAIALTTGGIGLGGVLVESMSLLFESIGGQGVGEGFHPWLAMLIVGAPIWWYRWARPWPGEASVPRLIWSVLVVILSLVTALGAATVVAVVVLQYVFTETSPAGQHFQVVPVALGLGPPAIALWLVHRRGLGDEPSAPVQFYRYTIAALGLATAVSTAVALTIVALDRDLIVGEDASETVAVATALVAGLVVWLVFERAGTHGDRHRAVLSWPRRIYTLGVGMVFSLVAAGALVTTIFIVLQRVLDAGATGSLLEPVAILLYSGAAGWYLISRYRADRTTMTTAEAVVPFDVTVICSHPGMIANRFPPQATLRVIYRADDAGRIDDEMAAEIVAEVANRNSLVWVDSDGFRVAPKRPAN